MSERRLLYFLLGVSTVISLGAVTNQIVALSGPGVAISDSGIVFPDGSVQTSAAGTPRKFYLTWSDVYTGATASTACASGYHMASLWEILDPTQLRYDPALGVTRADSGLGPPSGLGGWIRTGYEGHGGPFGDPGGDGGLVNCHGYTYSGISSDGTIVYLNPCWEEDAACSSGSNRAAAWWRSQDLGCPAPTRVWCVQN